RGTGVDDLDAGAVQVNAGIAGGFLNLLLTTQQDGGAELLVRVGDGCAHDLLFFTFGEDDALGAAAHFFIDALECCGDRVATGRKLLRIALEVDDRLAGNAGVHCSLGDGNRNSRDQARIERNGDDVFAAVARTRTLVGGNHVIRHILTGERGQRFSGGDLHRVVDGGGLNIQCAAEDVGETEDVVHLVRVIRTAGC